MTITFDSQSADDLRLQRLFFPDATVRTFDLLGRGGRFVHYTSAEVAVSIIQNAEVWMRNATTMNDFLEVEHGLRCLHAAWKDQPSAQRFREFLDRLHPGLAQEIADRFDAWQPDLRTNTFLTCLSEHLDTEDVNGRLSMWRAYGGQSGVALVLNTGPFAAVTDELKAYSSPVLYLSEQDFGEHFANVVDEIVNNEALVSGYSRELFVDLVFAMFRFAVLCTKHPGFAEEREWRIIYSPNLAISRAIKSEVKVVRGTPQVIQKIPLKNAPEDGLHGAAIPDILDRLIIGPTEDGVAVFQAFVTLLEAAGVKDAHTRVTVSGIPLRQ